jgi:hypothetical protein
MRRTSAGRVYPSSHPPTSLLFAWEVFTLSVLTLEERALFTDDRGFVCRSSTGSRPSVKGEEGRCVRSALILASTSS